MHLDTQRRKGGFARSALACSGRAISKGGRPNPGAIAGPDPERPVNRSKPPGAGPMFPDELPKTDRGTANLRTTILDFRRFDSSSIVSSRGDIFMSIGNFPESLSQAILVGIILVGRLGVGGIEAPRGASPRGSRLPHASSYDNH